MKNNFLVGILIAASVFSCSEAPELCSLNPEVEGGTVCEDILGTDEGIADGSFGDVSDASDDSSDFGSDAGTDMTEEVGDTGFETDEFEVGEVFDDIDGSGDIDESTFCKNFVIDNPGGNCRESVDFNSEVTIRESGISLRVFPFPVEITRIDEEMSISFNLEPALHVDDDGSSSTLHALRVFSPRDLVPGHDHSREPVFDLNFNDKKLSTIFDSPEQSIEDAVAERIRKEMCEYTFSIKRDFFLVRVKCNDNTTFEREQFINLPDLPMESLNGTWNIEVISNSFLEERRVGANISNLLSCPSFLCIY